MFFGGFPLGNSQVRTCANDDNYFVDYRVQRNCYSVISLSLHSKCYRVRDDKSLTVIVHPIEIKCHSFSLNNRRVKITKMRHTMSLNYCEVRRLKMNLIFESPLHILGVNCRRPVEANSLDIVTIHQ